MYTRIYTNTGHSGSSDNSCVSLIFARTRGRQQQGDHVYVRHLFSQIVTLNQQMESPHTHHDNTPRTIHTVIYKHGSPSLLTPRHLAHPAIQHHLLSVQTAPPSTIRQHNCTTQHHLSAQLHHPAPSVSTTVPPSTICQHNCTTQHHLSTQLHPIPMILNTHQPERAIWQYFFDSGNGALSLFSRTDPGSMMISSGRAFSLYSMCSRSILAASAYLNLRARRKRSR